MADKYVSTVLVQSNDIVEIQKADLDLLKKVNEVNNKVTDVDNRVTTVNSRITVSTELPTSNDGVEGDVWIQV